MRHMVFIHKKGEESEWKGTDGDSNTYVVVISYVLRHHINRNCIIPKIKYISPFARKKHKNHKFIIKSNGKPIKRSHSLIRIINKFR